MRRALRRMVLFAGSASVSWALILNLCHAVFDCGCRSWWSGAAASCNIHTAGVKHCPWCSYSEAAFLGAFALILAPQLVLSFWPARWGWLSRLLAMLASFPVAGSAVAVAFGMYAGYWR